MNNITRSIFRAIHEGRWLSIEYKNQQTQQTKYWVAIRGLNPRTRTLNVDGLHLGKLSVQALDHISIDRIQTAEVVDGSWCPVNQTLIDDIRDNPGRYAALFDNAANLRVLDYLAACNRLFLRPKPIRSGKPGCAPTATPAALAAATVFSITSGSPA